jgi:hypothetical protein
MRLTITLADDCTSDDVAQAVKFVADRLQSGDFDVSAQSRLPISDKVFVTSGRHVGQYKFTPANARRT